MEPKFQTSFIPKKPITASKGVMRQSINFLMIIGVVVFLISVLFTSGVYAYKFLLNNSIKNLQKDLSDNRAKFPEQFINDMSRFNNRIENSKTLLKNHLAPNTIFGFLADHTISTISYSDFSYVYNPDDTVTITLHGIARGASGKDSDGYKKIVLQAKEFSNQNQYIKNPIFSGVSVDQNQNVLFTLTAVVDRNLISYSKMIAQGASAGSQNTTTTSSSTSTNI